MTVACTYYHHFHYYSSIKMIIFACLTFSFKDQKEYIITPEPL